MKFFFDIFDYVMVLQLLAVSIAMVLIFRHLTKEAKTVLRCFMHVVISFALGTLLNYSLFELADHVPMLKGINFPLSWLITILLYITFFSVMPLNSRIIMAATLYVAIVTLTELGHYGAMVFGMLTSSDAVSISFYIIEDVLIIASAIFLKKFSISKYTDIPVISVVLILLNSFVLTSIIYVNTRLMMVGQNEADIFYCVVLLGEFILVITGYLMIWFHCQVRKEKMELEVENRLLEADRNSLLISEAAVEEVRGLRHDIKNQYQVMKMLLDDRKYDELNKYFDSMSIGNNLGQGIKYFDCGNELINSIMNMELMKATSCGVDFTAKITVNEEISVEKSDLCRIIVNLVDNAIEATDRYEAYDKPVDCKISKNKDYVYICVRNGLGKAEDKQKTLELMTSKKDPMLHGFGHRIVQRLVDKYQGYIKYSVEEDEFLAEVMLSLASEKIGG